MIAALSFLVFILMKTILSLTSVAVSLTFSSLSFANTPVEFQKIPEIMSQFEHAQSFVKKGITLGRLAQKKRTTDTFSNLYL